MRSNRIAVCASGGMNGLAKRSATWNKAPTAASLSNTGSKCSAINPEGSNVQLEWDLGAAW